MLGGWQACGGLCREELHVVDVAWQAAAADVRSEQPHCPTALTTCLAMPLPAGLSLPQAQVLAELFGGRSALLDPPRPATIKTLVAFQAYWDRHPHLYEQICQV